MNCLCISQDHLSGLPPAVHLIKHLTYIWSATMAGCPAEHRTTYQFLRGNSWQLRVVEHFRWGSLRCFFLGTFPYLYRIHQFVNRIVRIFHKKYWKTHGYSKLSTLKYNYLKHGMISVSCACCCKNALNPPMNDIIRDTFLQLDCHPRKCKSQVNVSMKSIKCWCSSSFEVQTYVHLYPPKIHSI